MSIKNKENGMGLVEVIFALGISVVIITSLVSLSLFTLRTSTQNKMLMRASKLATQEMELVRAYRDSMKDDWDGFVSSLGVCDEGNYCHITTGDPLGVDNTFLEDGSTDAEKITYFFTAADNGDYVRISVTASWVIGEETKYVHNYTDLTNWQN